jgi:hypothetical protein
VFDVGTRLLCLDTTAHSLAFSVFTNGADDTPGLSYYLVYCVCGGLLG